ncbi:MAG: hypothetical protein IAC42_06490 [Spirochaetes bacterium]|uniref:Uncharacterized protein n=1 Tax=Candidatus Aphodenecus pullistercoris TaxID=2840669 RepID=A0A9D9E8R4_9SPIR|nr:hypothetical protein [Candidatus Aphodenecus pullistercoris]
METAFNMRHRLMCVLEKVLDDEVLSGKVELDETYVDSIRKGVGRGRDAYLASRLCLESSPWA